MNEKIRILFHNMDGAGVNYFRTQTPAIELEKNHSDKFYVEISPSLDFNNPETINYLKSFNIIHYHRQILPDVNEMLRLAMELKEAGVVLVMDIDDYWYLPKKHPYYEISKANKLHLTIMDNLKIADYVTTTTDLIANEIKKITKKDNVIVLPNSINPDTMKQFANNWKPDPDGRVRITYMAGSCYDDKTEIFTENGWKLFKDLNKSEMVATLNQDTNEFEYQLPTEYINVKYSGDMYYGKNSLIDFAVTPNHNMYIVASKYLRRKKPFNFKLKSMESVDKFDLTFKKNCNWIGNDDEFIIIPKHETTKQNEIRCAEIKIKMDDWLKFFGYWMGDGWTTNDGTHHVGLCGYKQIGIETMSEIKNIFDKYNISSSYTNNGNTLRFFCRPLFNYLAKFKGANEKYIPRNILNLNKEKLNIFLEYYLRADGHTRINGRKTASTCSIALANNLNEIALKLGVSATVINRGIRKGERYIDNRLIHQNYNEYDINFYLGGFKNNLTPTIPNKNIYKSTYNGNIYCVTVPNHVIYVRRNGKSYWCGNSHQADIEQLDGVINALSNDPELTDKFKIIIAGWDTEGKTTEVDFNQEFADELQKKGLLTKNMVNEINKSNGNVDLIKSLPNDLKEKYRNNIMSFRERPIRSEESVYLYYEKILTDNHNLIKNKDYIQWLSNYERGRQYHDEGNFARRWTQKANVYANVLNETDIVIAPLELNDFNTKKSNLKQVECWTRKLPIICSDIPPYNVDGRHMENCILVKSDKLHAYKDWKKYLKRLILDADLRKKLGEQLYEDFKLKYNLEYVTNNRADFYANITKK